MYLSKIIWAKTPQAKRALINLYGNRDYSAHQLLWRLFTEEEKREFLFREEITSNGQTEFYVLSRSKPIELPEFIIQTKPWQPILQQGLRLAFKLRINPTIRTGVKQGGGRHDVLMHAKHQASLNGVADVKEIKKRMFQAAQDWLMNDKRLIDWGISFDFSPDIERYTQHQNKKNNGEVIRFSSIDVQGVLTVQHPERLIENIITGFGRSKSLGCGLMLIRRV